jgi:membrane protein
MPAAEPFAPFLARRLWPGGPAPASGWRARLLAGLRIAYAVIRDVADGRLSNHAASLVYTTILSLVPAMALAFSVLKGFGVHHSFEPLLMQALKPLGSQGQEIVQRLLEFVDRMEVGVLGAVGLAMLFYTAISVVQKVEDAFNQIWHVEQPRSMARKFTDYLSVLLIGPVLLFSAIGLGASVLASETIRQLSEYRPIWMLIDQATRLAPFGLVAAGLTFLYKFLPNARVRFVSAVIGALIATVIWAIAGWAFATFVRDSASYTAIYSAFAALILFFIWLNANWLVLLIGATIAFYHQHPQYMPIGSGAAVLSIRSRERLALAAMALIAEAHYRGEPPLSTDQLRSRLRVPAETIHRVLDALADGGLLAPTAGEPTRWLPVRALETTPLATLLAMVRGAGERPGLDQERIPASAPVIDVEHRLQAAGDRALDGLFLKDLVVKMDATSHEEGRDERAA